MPFAFNPFTGNLDYYQTASVSAGTPQSIFVEVPSFSTTGTLSYSTADGGSWPADTTRIYFTGLKHIVGGIAVATDALYTDVTTTLNDSLTLQATGLPDGCDDCVFFFFSGTDCYYYFLGSFSVIAGDTGPVAIGGPGDFYVANFVSTLAALRNYCGWVDGPSALLSPLGIDVSAFTVVGNLSASNLSGDNTGDETADTIKAKLGGTTATVGGMTFDAGIYISGTPASRTPSVVTKASNYTATSSDDVILCSGTLTVSLPPASTNSGLILRIKNIGSGVVTIDPNASEQIDGDASLVLDGTNDCAEIVCNGTYWSII